MTGNAFVKVSMSGLMIVSQARTPPITIGTHSLTQEALLRAVAVVQGVD